MISDLKGLNEVQFPRELRLGVGVVHLGNEVGLNEVQFPRELRL